MGAQSPFQKLNPEFKTVNIKPSLTCPALLDLSILFQIFCQVL